MREREREETGEERMMRYRYAMSAETAPAEKEEDKVFSEATDKDRPGFFYNLRLLRLFSNSN
jgi:hypothetical protein